MHSAILEIRTLAVALFAILISEFAPAQSGGAHTTEQAATDAGEFVDELQTVEREQAARLRRAREAHEAQRTEDARRREAELARQMEVSRARADVLRDERRESFLQHESWQLRQAVRMPLVDPGDHSAIAKRGELDRHLLDQRQELHQTMTSRDDALRRLQQVQPR